MGNTLVKPSVPAAKRIASVLEERITQGVYPRGSWLPPERVLAEELGVSRPVLREALTNLLEKELVGRKPGCRPRVHGTQREGRRHHYEGREAIAPALQTIALIAPVYRDRPTSSSIIRGIQRALQVEETSYRLLLFGTDANGKYPSPEREAKALEAVAQEQISGVILWQIGAQKSRERLSFLEESDIPVVFIDRRSEETPCDFVGIDNRLSARQATEYLLQLGHRRIGFLNYSAVEPEANVQSVADRIRGYRETMRAHGLPPILHAGISQGVADVLTPSEAPITAVIAVNDNCAYDFISAAERHGRRVPEDISVIGFDNMDRDTCRPTMLTTVDIPFEQIGEQAADLLLRRLRSSDARSKEYQHILLPTSLVLRGSCRSWE